ncbi:hypothetical protein ACFW16_33210 [Inquilinus sp. NPDC058860]|uniref:hypothetical protein n=1 Tax=Inquilinus sp. NPDC058860 TaxID=3346652 RepID=UPI0036CBEF28
MSDRTPSALPGIPGGAELIEWYGFIPNFHDATVLSVAFANDGRGEIRIHTWRMTDQSDERGYIILDKHAVVTLSLEDIREINLGISHDLGGIYDLSLSAAKDGFRIEWENTCGTGGPGIEGSIRARRVSVSFVPGKPSATVPGA